MSAPEGLETLAIHATEAPSSEARQRVREALPILNRYRVLATPLAAALLRDEGVRRVEEVASVSHLVPDSEEKPLACFLLTGSTPLLATGYEELLETCLDREVAFALNAPSVDLMLHGLRAGRRAALIFNPISGAGDAAADLARIRSLLEPGLHLIVKETTSERTAESLVREAIENEEVELVIAAGGDGTVTEVASALRGSDTVLGIIPRGTANALATSLFGAGLHLDPIGVSCRAILDGATRTIDTALCNGRLMLQLAGIGVETGMNERASRDLKSKFGVLAYLVGGWQQINAQEEFEVEVECDGRTQRFRTFSVVVANAAPPTSVFAQGNGAPIFDDGHLDVTTIVDVNSTWEAVDTMLRLLNAGLTHSETGDRVVHFRGKKVRITATPEQKVVVDGEVSEKTPVEFEVLPHSLRVIAPPVRD